MNPDNQDSIGCWGSRMVGKRYGESYRLEQLTGSIEKVVLADLPRG